MIFLFANCKKENAFDCFKSTGADVIETRSVEKFDVIKVFNKIDLNIIKGPEFKVEVTAGKHVIKNIKTIVADSALNIKDENKCNFVRGYKRQVTVNVTLPYLVRVESRGVGTVRFAEGYVQDTVFIRAENSGDIYVNGNFNQIRTSSHGNGDIYLNGACNSLYVYMYGTNVLKGENLTINNYVFVETVSIGDCFVAAPTGGTLDCNIWRNGNVFYKGNPSSANRFAGDGKGKLIKEN